MFKYILNTNSKHNHTHYEPVNHQHHAAPNPGLKQLLCLLLFGARMRSQIIVERLSIKIVWVRAGLGHELPLSLPCEASYYLGSLSGH